MSPAMHLPPLDWSHARRLPPAPPPAAAAAADLNGFFAPLLATVSRQVDAQEVQNNIHHTHVEHMIDKSGEAKNR